MSERTTEEILQESIDLYSRKNDDYANSWRLTGETIALWLEREDIDQLEIEANTKLIAMGLYTRRLDKMIRSFMQMFAHEGEVQVDESIVETTEDQVPYAAMQTAIAEELAHESKLARGYQNKQGYD